ncbi:putative nuclease HARBI1 [Rhipicephalus sanguineus]|uniref:putative nuclease HARBI1 n=1 Tax=Rhipicephalus sanguineus TaxID=34632 RepID=UPI0020C2BB9A|nr:putative nuclease HARBI1 [Rhipicephalus sanguineus]
MPETVVSDNGPQLVSEEFKAFMRDVGARHVVSAPYHLSTNGLAERFVQTLKSALRKSLPVVVLAARERWKKKMALPFIVQWLQLQAEREFREHCDAFSMPEELFRLRYRLTKDMVRWLCGELRRDLERRRTGTRTALTVEQQVLCALRFFATGSYQGAIASDEDVATSQSSRSSSASGDEWIAFPASAQELAAAKEGFVHMDPRFEGCIGAVDGTFVCIRAPYERDDGNKAAYFCRKGFYALNVMVVCDATLRITALDPSYPGSVHDAFVWRAFTLSQEFNGGSRGQGGEFLLGDSAYPLQPWLLTPIPGAHQAGSPAARFNRAHSSLRCVVERCIGVLKARFRCLQRYRALYYGPLFTSKIISACAVLHNLSVRQQLPEPDDIPGTEEGEDPDVYADDDGDVAAVGMYQAGTQRRDRLLQWFTAGRDST